MRYCDSEPPIDHVARVFNGGTRRCDREAGHEGDCESGPFTWSVTLRWRPTPPDPVARMFDLSAADTVESDEVAAWAGALRLAPTSPAEREL